MILKNDTIFDFFFIFFKKLMLYNRKKLEFIFMIFLLNLFSYCEKQFSEFYKCFLKFNMM